MEHFKSLVLPNEVAFQCDNTTAQKLERGRFAEKCFKMTRQPRLYKIGTHSGGPDVVSVLLFMLVVPQ